MRSEAEIKARLKKVRKKMKAKPTFWRVLVWQVHEDILNWVLAEGREK